MATISLSRAGKAYVRAVVAAGGGVIIYALLQIGLRPPHHYWLLLAALTLFAGPFAIRVPSLRATVSTSEAFVFALVLFFGPAPAALTVALDGLLVSLWARHRNVYRALFNITEPAISVWIAAQLFYALAEVEPLWGQPVGIGQLWLPLLVLTMSYFLLNSWLQATAVWFETQVSPQRFLHTQLSQLSLTSFASVCLVVLLVLNADNLSFAAIGVFVPLLVMSYVSSKMAIERTETQAALGESEKRFRELVENVNDGLWMVDAKTHQVLYVNHAFERIWGRRLGEIAGTHMDWADAIHAEDRERVQNAFRQHAATGYFSEEYRVVQPDGTTRWVNARGFPVKDPGRRDPAHRRHRGGRHRAAQIPAATGSVAEKGRHRPDGRRHRPRLQQHPDGHSRLQ